MFRMNLDARETAPATRRQDRRNLVRLIGCGAIAVLVFAIYGQCGGDEFIEFDDGSYVFRNPLVTAGLAWSNFVRAVTAMESANWHPVTWWSHMLDVQLFGLNAGAHALMNAGLHCLAALALFHAFGRLTGKIGVAAFVAMVFAVHPCNVENVAWVAERKSTLSALFGFLALSAYAGYSISFQYRNYWAAVLWYALSLASKPMLVSLPILLLLLDYWPLRRARLPLRDQRGAGLEPGASAMARPVPHLLLEKAPFMVLAAVSCVLTSIAQYQAGAMGDLERINWSARLGNVAFSYVRYLGKLFVPHNHALLYPFPEHYTPALVAVCVITLVAVTAWGVCSARIRPELLVGWCWFLITLLPVIGLLQVGSQSMADRYLYIPMIGPLLGLAWAVQAHMQRRPALRRAVMLVGWGWAAVLALGAWVQASYWRSSETILVQSVTNTRGNFIHHGALGIYYYGQGRYMEAANQFRLGLATRPKNPALLANLAMSLGQMGRIEEAINLLERSLHLDPSSAANHNNLAVYQLHAGEIPKAIEGFREAIRLKPDYSEARRNLAGALELQPGSIHNAVGDQSQEATAP